MENEYPDYDLLMRYKDYVLYGVDEQEVHNGKGNDGSNLLFTEINSEVRSHLLTLHFGIGIRDLDYDTYISTEKLLNPRLSLIRELNLDEHELLILVLLSIAPWGAKTTKPFYISVKKKDSTTLEAEIDEMCHLLNLIQLCDDKDPSGESYKWSFVSGQVKFRATGGSEADLRLPSVEPDSLKHILLDYLQLVRSSGETVRDRMKLISERPHFQFNVSNKNKAWQPHYIFLYNFISFLENSTQHSTRNGNLRTNQLRIYLALLEEAGYKIKSSYGLEGDKKIQPNIKVLERWYNRGKRLVSDYQRNNT
jgi:hypothetical protein